MSEGIKTIKHWSLTVTEELEDSVRDGAKTLEVRMLVRSSGVIAQILQYKPGDLLMFEFGTAHRSREQKVALTRVTGPCKMKPLRELTDEEVSRITGHFQLTREQLIHVLCNLYGPSVNANSTAYLVPFERPAKQEHLSVMRYIGNSLTYIY